MEERQRGRSRRGKSQKSRKGAGGILVCLVILALVAAAVFCLRYVKNKEHKAAAERESSVTVERELFPDDEGRIGDGTAGSDGADAKDTGDREEGGTKTVSAETFLGRMTLEEKVLQLFMVTPEALTGVDEVYAAGEKTKEAIETYPVGGIVYFKQNLRSPEQVTDMLTRTAKYSRDRIGLDPFLAVDEEGGQVARISGREEFSVPAIPDMSEIGASGEPAKAYEAGDQIGTFLSKLGFNVDFAPVADVLTNPDNTAVVRRSFGSDGAVTAVFVNEFVKGLQKHEVSAVLKHFPGHGGTENDTHDGYAQTQRTLEELMAEDFVPFKEGIENGADFIMVAHIAAPAVTGGGTPASLSEKMVTQILRGQLGYDGIVVTDALNMKAITDSYSSADASVQALQAGADILLMPDNFKEAYQGVLDAVHSKRLSEERINQSVLRILKVKLGEA